jgi:hypothetical protein
MSAVTLAVPADPRLPAIRQTGISLTAEWFERPEEYILAMSLSFLEANESDCPVLHLIFMRVPEAIVGLRLSRRAERLCVERPAPLAWQQEGRSLSFNMSEKHRKVARIGESKGSSRGSGSREPTRELLSVPFAEQREPGTFCDLYNLRWKGAIERRTIQPLSRQVHLAIRRGTVLTASYAPSSVPSRNGQ